MLPTPGNIVRARSRRYLVEDVVPPPAAGDDTLVRLSCLDDDAQGEPLDQHDVPQLVLPGFNEEERRQLEADLRHWKKRMGELSAELAGEPARVKASYEVRARRVDPIGIVYLWPATG